jgi:predicted RNase H-like HicB family nuclease
MLRDLFKERQKITFKIDICIEKDEGGFYAYCPALEGIHVDGETEKEALENAKIAVSLYLNSLIKHNDPIPLQIVKDEKCQEKSVICPSQFTENVLVAL